MEQFLWIAVCMAVVLAGLVPWIISLVRRIVEVHGGRIWVES